MVDRGDYVDVASRHFARYAFLSCVLPCTQTGFSVPAQNITVTELAHIAEAYP